MSFIKTPPGRSITPWAEATLFLVLAMAFLLPGLNRGLLFDEYKTRMVIDLGWAELFRERLNAGHLPTYFAMVKAWLTNIPYSNWAMRYPGVMFAALGVIPFYYIGRRIAGPAGGRLVAFIYVSNQLVIWAGQAARPYGPLLFFEGVTVLAAMNWWVTSRMKWLIMAGVASLLGIIMMPLAGLVTLALILGIMATWREFNSRLAWPLVVSLATSMVIGFLPAILVASSQEKLAVDRGWQFPKFGKISEAIATMIYGDYTLWARGIMEYLSQALFIVCIYFGYRRWSSLKKDPAAATPSDPTAAGDPIPWRTWLMFWIFAPLVALVLVTAFTGVSMVSHSRYQTPAVGGVIVLFGVALARFRAATAPPLVKQGITVLVLAPLVITAMAWHRDPGEGVAPVAREMVKLSGGVPERVAGHVRWLRPELPQGQIPANELFIERRPLRINELLIAEAEKIGHNVQVMDYDKEAKDITAITETLARWAGGEPFWLFVYIQKKDGLDLVAEAPPAGYRLHTTVRKKYARAYYFTR